MRDRTVPASRRCYSISSTRDGKFRRIFAHRQTWLRTGSLTLTPESRRRFEKNRRHNDRRADSLWLDHAGEETHAAVLFDLVAQENKRARLITQRVESNKIKRAKEEAKTASPFRRLNDLLALGTLAVSLHNPDDVEIVARIGDGPTFGIERMSDGERNAVIIAAAVLTVEPETTLLIDEPERHLHRSIITPFLSAVFEQRKDCAFVVSTHEVSLPLASPGARVLMTRSCTWAGGSPSDWDVQLLQRESGLPEALKLAILGARSRVLFVEGTSTSLDIPLYGVLFPGLSVSSCGSCVDVHRAVGGLRATLDHHHVEAFGIIDRDSRSDEEVGKLVSEGVFALDVYSVEALYYCSDAVRAVACRQAASRGLDAKEMVESAKRQALDALRQDDMIERMAARRSEGRVRDAILSQTPDWKAIRTATGSVIELRVESAYTDEVAHFRRLLKAGDFDALVARYPLRESTVFVLVATALKCSSVRDYEQMVVVRAGKDTALATALKKRIRPLVNALQPGSFA